MNSKIFLRGLPPSRGASAALQTCNGGVGLRREISGSIGGGYLLFDGFWSIPK
jgi:hypothetical protein